MDKIKGEHGLYWIRNWLTIGRLSVKTMHVGIHGYVMLHVDKNAGWQLMVRLKKAKRGGIPVIGKQIGGHFAWLYQANKTSHGVTSVIKGEAIYLLVGVRK
jgi:hypothetical protein